MPNSGLLWFILIVTLGTVQSDHDDQVSYVYGYRAINWCVVGRAEPQFFEWPFVQFKPFLLRTAHYYKDFANPKRKGHDEIPFGTESPERQDYENQLEDLQENDIVEELPNITISFKSIKCASQQFIGHYSPSNETYDMQSAFHNRMHIQLNFNHSDPRFEGVEGVLIQAVHAPFGMGFPFGQFDNGEDMQCNCSHMHAKIIPCISRPDWEILAPTVAAFHHNMLSNITPSAKAAEKNETFPREASEAGKKTELHFNFKWHSTMCSSAKTVEFWVLVIYNFLQPRFEIKKFGPYHQFQTRMHPTKPDAHKDIDLGNHLKWHYQLDNGLVNNFNVNANNGTKPAPADRNVDRFIQNPVHMPSPLFPKCREAVVSDANCQPANNDTNPNKKPKNCTETYFVDCHSDTDYFPDPPGDDDTPKGKIRIIGDFDAQCVARYPPKDRAGRQCPKWTARLRCAGTFDVLRRMDAAIKNRREDSADDPIFPDTLCEPCKYEATTEDHTPTEPPIPFIKRSPHGILMVFAFFYALPLAIFIGRFYKETFHDIEEKGWRMWLWIHVGVCIFLMLLAYAAYNLPAFWLLDAHMYWGYGALFCGLFGLISGWGREKSKWGLKLSLFFHAVSGYATAVCAGMSFAYAPLPCTRIAKIVIIIVQVCCLVFWFALTCHVCVVDHKLGMKPKRKHIPILQVRFDDAYVPGHRGRRYALLIFAVLLYIVIWVSLII